MDVAHPGEVGGRAKAPGATGSNGFVAYVSDVAVPALNGVNFGLINIEAQHRNASLYKTKSQGKSHIAQANHTYRAFAHIVQFNTPQNSTREFFHINHWTASTM